MERRTIRGSCEVRMGPNGPMLYGYAAKFDRPSEDLGGFIESIDPGAFTKTVQEADVRGLGNHDVNWLLGRTKPGTLRMTVDPIGLAYEIDINEQDPDGQRAIQKVRRGDWDGSSFSFTTIRDSWDWQSSPPQRRLLEVALTDVGPVTFPAYPDATVAARALERLSNAVGHPVDKLVTAMRSGEIRSLIEPDDAPEESRQTVTVREFRSREERAGMTISAATREVLEGAVGMIQNLLGGAEPDDDEMGPAGTDPADVMGSDTEDDTDTLSGTNSTRSLRIMAAVRALTAPLIEVREIPDGPGDGANLTAMAGAVVGAYQAKLVEYGLAVPEDGFTLCPIADQDGDQDGDGPTTWSLCDEYAQWYFQANGDQAEFLSLSEWEYSWEYDTMRSRTPATEHRSAPDPRLLEALAKIRERDGESLRSYATA